MSEKPRAKAYVYTRVSTAMQVDGFSLDAQRDEIRGFAELKKIDIVGEYCDKGKVSVGNIKKVVKPYIKSYSYCILLYTVGGFAVGKTSLFRKGKGMLKKFLVRS